MNCNKINEIIGHFDQEMYCFTIFEQLKGEPDKRYLVHEDSSVTLMVGIKLLKLETWVTLSFHARTQPVLSRFVRGNILVKINGGLNLITYRKTVVKYLFNPSTNPCFEGKTHEDCVAECKFNEFIDRTRRYPPINLARFNSSMYFAISFDNSTLTMHNRNERLYRSFTKGEIRLNQNN